MLALRQQLLSDSSGTQVWLTDLTLAYAAVSNAGGWGAPNLELNQTALLAYVGKWVVSADATSSVLTALVPISSAIAYLNTNPNTVQQSIGFNYLTDGHYTSVLMAIPAAVNDTTTLAGNTIVNGNYYYKAGVIYQKTAGGILLVTDYSLPAADGGVIKVTYDKMFFNKLSVKNQLEYYRDYCAARNLNDPDAANALRDKMDELKIDLSGAIWEFAAANYRTAENIVDQLLEKHEIE